MISEDPIIDYDDSQKISDLDFVEDQESEPSINHRRKYKGKYKSVLVLIMFYKSFKFIN